MFNIKYLSFFYLPKVVDDWQSHEESVICAASDEGKNPNDDMLTILKRKEM